MSFNRGQVILAKVIELVSKEVFIVSIYGHLFRVVNESGRTIRNQDVIELKVVQADPLRLKMIDEKNSKLELSV